MDNLSATERSEIMSRVRSKNSRPEMAVRKLVFALGYRYRLHERDLPGRPDLVFRQRRKVIFVHGCYWHRHAGCALARLPKSRLDFWLPKLEGNRARRPQQPIARRGRLGCADDLGMPTQRHGGASRCDKEIFGCGVELFAGAGGLAIGMANSGFHHAAVVEWDHDACETFRENQRRHTRSVEEWPLHEGDVRQFSYAGLNDVMVVSGGPPCQPFSMGGKHPGFMDQRDMFPEAVRAVRELRPKAFVFENVKGLMREKFSDYFEYIILQLTHPSLTRGAAEPRRAGSGIAPGWRNTTLPAASPPNTTWSIVC